MKTRLFAIGLVIVSSAVAACGGGGGGNANPPMQTAPPSPSPSPSPTPGPTLDPNGCPPSPAAVRRTLSTSPRPIGPGDSFAYAGSYSQTVVRSAPCPEPTATSLATLVTSVNDAATTAPDGNPGVTSQTVEVATFPTNQLTTTTDALLQENASQALMYSTASTDSNGNSVSTLYTTPQIIDELPETAGQQWSNDPAGTVNETFADGTSTARTVSSNGTYTETDNLAGLMAQIQTNADGSGTYTLFGFGTLRFAAPSGGSIVLTLPLGTLTVPAWFATPVNLYADSFVDNGLQTFDPTCRVPSSVTNATQGDQIVETLTVTDPVLGYTETRTTASYDLAGLGQVCIVLADSLKSYYNYANDTLFSLYTTQDGNPLQTDTIAQTIALSAPPTVFSSRRAALERGIAPSFVEAQLRAIDQVRAVERERRIRALRAFTNPRIRKGGVR